MHVAADLESMGPYDCAEMGSITKQLYSGLYHFLIICSQILIFFYLQVFFQACKNYINLNFFWYTWQDAQDQNKWRM